MIVEQVPIRIYSPAKMVVDLFKLRNKIELDVALEALKDVLYQNKQRVLNYIILQNRACAKNYVAVYGSVGINK